MSYQFPELDWNTRSITLSYTIAEGISAYQRGKWYIPDYQRPLCWTVEQKIAFMESLILGLPIGEYCVCYSEKSTESWEILDGQQRWSAIFGYIENEFPVFGLYYRDLNEVSLRKFKNVQFSQRRMENLTLNQKIEAYNRLAYGGTPHDKV